MLRVIPLKHDGKRYRVYDWTTATAWRVLVQFDDGTEIDIVRDKVTQCSRRWDDGKELGRPELN